MVKRPLNSLILFRHHRYSLFRFIFHVFYLKKFVYADILNKFVCNRQNRRKSPHAHIWFRDLFYWKFLLFFFPKIWLMLLYRLKSINPSRHLSELLIANNHSKFSTYLNKTMYNSHELWIYMQIKLKKNIYRTYQIVIVVVVWMHLYMAVVKRFIFWISAKKNIPK